MAKLLDEAKNYETKTTKNIADLDKVSTDLEVEDREGKDSEGQTFKYKVVVVDGEDYKIPGIVLGNLKSILEKKPDLKFFSVSKTGTGINTRYTVIPQ